MKKQISIEYQQFDHWSELSESDQMLVRSAYDALDSAYAPYSKFSVGASALLSNGDVIKGSNQENMAYPSGLCAERVALFYAGANFPNEKVDALCVVASGDLLDYNSILAPCGGCRQVMLETEHRQEQAYRVILVSQNSTVILFDSAASLLPIAFGT
ncbi:cytidine deaminase [Crocinitomicaceae bacterium]|nr:cytidine deaminase [Crocinitomicaceae bacterium]